MSDSLLVRVRLPVIVLAQFAGTSLWFAGNAILPDLQPLLNNPDLNGWITSAVQLGFIGGTLLYALLAIPDRFPTTQVFLVSVLLAAMANAGWLFLPLQASTVLVSRLLTGFFLAGVYPVGMKLAADWFRPVLGRAMGFLVGALVLGTAFPHLLRGVKTSLPYHDLMLSVSGLAIGGGLLLFLIVPSKPLPAQRSRFRMDAIRTLLQPSAYRPAMFGYFGHMWELYSVWAFLPLLISSYNTLHPTEPLNVPLTSFLTIAAGMLGCVLGGFRALQIGSRRVARALLITSGVCLLLLPLFMTLPSGWFALFLLIWGAAAAGDSPQFSTLVASYAPPEIRGSTLTLVTCLGFLITVVSIQTMAGLIAQFGASVWLFWLLLPGPLLGVLAIAGNDE